MKKISIMMLMASSFWGVAQERPELEEVFDPDELHTLVVLMEPIATDRPDITESAFITPIGWFQCEGGYQYSHAEESLPGGSVTDSHQFEEVLRFGINQRFELRAVINANTERIDQPSTWNDPMRRTGVSPITFGFKYNLIKESDVSPQITWLSQVSNSWIALGDYASVYPEQIFHEQRLTIEKGITDRFSLGTNIGAAGAMTGSNGFINEGMFSIAAGYDLGNNWSTYAEYFMDWRVISGQFQYTPNVDGGMTKLLTNDLQFDIYAGYNLSEYFGTRLPSTGWFIGTGVSYRLPLAHYLR
tara:strand:- start:698 stop:1600 length:903 start_codon:yes stop_codon:yes gene_type:complete